MKPLAYALSLLALAGCAGANHDAVGTTATTAADVPPVSTSSVELFVARNASGVTCPQNLPHSLPFRRGSADMSTIEAADLDKWAACMRSPDLEHATVVLAGGEDADPFGHDELFTRRATHIREALAARGVDPSRILIAAQKKAGAENALAPDRVRVEMTTSSTVREMAR